MVGSTTITSTKSWMWHGTLFCHIKKLYTVQNEWIVKQRETEWSGSTKDEEKNEEYGASFCAIVYLSYTYTRTIYSISFLNTHIWVSVCVWMMFTIHIFCPNEKKTKKGESVRLREKNIINELYFFALVSTNVVAEYITSHINENKKEPSVCAYMRIAYIYICFNNCKDPMLIQSNAVSVGSKYIVCVSYICLHIIPHSILSTWLHFSRYYIRTHTHIVYQSESIYCMRVWNICSH